LLEPVLMPGILDRDIEATESFGRQAYIKFNRRIYYVTRPRASAFLRRMSVGEARGCWYSGGYLPSGVRTPIHASRTC
jgi:hypothetical protein